MITTQLEMERKTRREEADASEWGGRAMEQTQFEFERYCDELGPAKIVHIYVPSCSLRAIVAVDNVACGPAIGGVRMAEDVTTDEVFRLARAMTLKNAAAGLPHGGGKAGIRADSKTCDKQRLMRAFARAIRDLREYIPGPDMGTDETCMAWVHDEMGRAVGLPRVLGGIPLDQIGATGFGVACAAEVAVDFCDLHLAGARLAVEGFGNVGRHAARYLARQGVQLVAASDSRGTLIDPRGINVDALERIKREGGGVCDYPGGEKRPLADLFHVACDILVPAARPDCIHAGNVDAVQARLILQGANIPCTAEAERRLHERGVLNVPDFICNAGGVICAAVEYAGGSERQAMEQIAERIKRNTREVLTRSREESILPRQAAVEMARQRVLRAMQFRT